MALLVATLYADLAKQKALGRLMPVMPAWSVAARGFESPVLKLARLTHVLPEMRAALALQHVPALGLVRNLNPLGLGVGLQGHRSSPARDTEAISEIRQTGSVHLAPAPRRRPGKLYTLAATAAWTSKAEARRQALREMAVEFIVRHPDRSTDWLCGEIAFEAGCARNTVLAALRPFRSQLDAVRDAANSNDPTDLQAISRFCRE